MKKFRTSEFMFEVFSLIVIVIIVQGFYATVVRPQAAAVAASDAAQMAKDPNFAPARNFYIIIKDYEQEVCFMLALWSVAIMGYKGFSLRRGQSLLGADLLRLQDEPRLLDNAADSDIARAAAMARSVRRDLHKMTAFVRFRRVEARDGKGRKEE